MLSGRAGQPEDVAHNLAAGHDQVVVVPQKRGPAAREHRAQGLDRVGYGQGRGVVIRALVIKVRRNRARSGRILFARLERHTGRTPPACPDGHRQSPCLWRANPLVAAADEVGRVERGNIHGIWPGEWARPRQCRCRGVELFDDRGHRETSEDPLVIWLMNAIRVRRLTPAMNASTTCSGFARGRGSRR